MALKVRDEGDVLEHNFRFHHALGVDHFVVTDNGSTDETVDILARYTEAGLATVTKAPDTDYREQGAQWMTDMARSAATELNADWVVHTDADEFWWPIEGTLRETLAAVPDRYGVLIAPRCEFIGRPDGAGSFAERLTIREASARYQPKVAHRADPDVVMMDRGPHDVAALGPSGDVTETIRPPGRPVHRVVRNRELGTSSWPQEDTRFVWAPRWPVRILHFPVRSSEQFKRRTQIAIFEGMFPDRGRFRRLREHYEAGRFQELYGELILDQGEVEEGLRTGRLVIDERFAHLLARCPDPLAGGTVGHPGGRARPRGPGARAGGARVRRHARLARTSRWLMANRERNRERMARLIEQRDEAQSKAKRARPPWAFGALPPLEAACENPALLGPELAPGRISAQPFAAHARRGGLPAGTPPRWLWFPPMPRYMVTGCAGFIGSTLVEALLADGCEVAGIDAFTDYYPRDRKEAAISEIRSRPAFQLLEHDLGSGPPPEEALEGIEGIFHLAARPGVRASWGAGFEAYVHDNVLATHVIADCAVERGLRVVFASSSSVYGDALAYPTREDAVPAPVSPYGVTKLTCEHLLRAQARNFDLDYAGLRYFTVYGPRQRPDMAFARIVEAPCSAAPASTSTATATSLATSPTSPTR